MAQSNDSTGVATEVLHLLCMDKTEEYDYIVAYWTSALVEPILALYDKCLATVCELSSFMFSLSYYALIYQDDF